MLISARDLNGLMTEAYKGAGGLGVFFNGKTWQINGARWRVEVTARFLPKKCLGKLVELIGKIPEPWEHIVADKEGVRQDTTMLKGAEELFNLADTEYESTRMIVVAGEFSRILQNDAKRSMVFVPERYYEMISMACVDVDGGEEAIDGPRTCTTPSSPKVACWATNQMAIAIAVSEAEAVRREAELMRDWHITRMTETASDSPEYADAAKAEARKYRGAQNEEKED